VTYAPPRASGKAPDNAPLRRAAKTLRNLMFTIPARIVRTGRRLILRPPAGFRHRYILKATFRDLRARTLNQRPPPYMRVPLRSATQLRDPQDRLDRRSPTHSHHPSPAEQRGPPVAIRPR
jgi:hypothetical protein